MQESETAVVWIYHDETMTVTASPGAIPASMIPIPADLFDSDSDSSHLGYDSDSDSSHLGYDSDSNTICMNDSDSIPTPALLIFLF